MRKLAREGNFKSDFQSNSKFCFESTIPVEKSVNPAAAFHVASPVLCELSQ